MAIGQRSSAFEPRPDYVLADVKPSRHVLAAEKFFRLLQNFERRCPACHGGFPSGAHSFRGSATQRLKSWRAAMKKRSSAWGVASTMAIRLEQRRHAMNEPSMS